MKATEGMTRTEKLKLGEGLELQHRSGPSLARGARCRVGDESLKRVDGKTACERLKVH